MKALGALMLLELLGRAWCCSPIPGDTNIARRGAASQSSFFPVTNNILGSPDKANDGVKALNWLQASCCHTDLDWEPWWRLDMKQRYKVNVVVIALRSDCCLPRNIGIEIRIGNSPDNNNPVCGKITSTKYLVNTFLCYGMEGQYVSLVVPGRFDNLCFCELEVYGDPMI